MDERTVIGQERLTLQERLEASRAGRWLISAVLVLVLFAVVVSSLPGRSDLARVALPAVRPLLGVTGLSQSWGMFAPDPPRRSTELVARIAYEDGSIDIWRPPAQDVAAGPYRGYHWRKWATAVLSDRSRRLWEPAVRWIAVHHDHGGRRPVRIQLIQRWQKLPAPGRGDKPGPWNERVFYSRAITHEGRS